MKSISSGLLSFDNNLYVFPFIIVFARLHILMINNVLSLPIEEEDDDDDGGWVLPMLGPVINSINSLDTLGDQNFISVFSSRPTV